MNTWGCTHPALLFEKIRSLSEMTDAGARIKARIEVVDLSQMVVPQATYLQLRSHSPLVLRCFRGNGIPFGR